MPAGVNPAKFFEMTILALSPSGSRICSEICANPMKTRIRGIDFLELIQIPASLPSQVGNIWHRVLKAKIHLYLLCFQDFASKFHGYKTLAGQFPTCPTESRLYEQQGEGGAEAKKTEWHPKDCFFRA